MRALKRAEALSVVVMGPMGPNASSIVVTVGPQGPLEALAAPTGGVTVHDLDLTVAEIEPLLLLSDGQMASFVEATAAKTAGARGGVVTIDRGATAGLEASVIQSGNGVKVRYAFAVPAPGLVRSCGAVVRVPLIAWRNAPMAAGEAQTGLSGALRDWKAPFDSKEVKSIALGPAPELRGLTLSIESPHAYCLAAKPGWAGGQHIDFQLTRGASEATASWGPGETKRVEIALSFSRSVRVIEDGPVVLEADDDWFPMTGELDVEPGSALDFSEMLGPRAAAGSFGWARAGRANPLAFEFERAPGRAARLYGPNLCMASLFLSHEEADRLAERLMRRGYNSIRVHHFETLPFGKLEPGFIDPMAGGDSLAFHRENMEKFDYLFAALKRRGFYVTTDLYVNRYMLRAAPAAELFDGVEGEAQLRFKSIVHVSRKAMENWKEFARRLLTHLNPYTGLAYKDDPALAWIALINEDNLLNFDLKSYPPEAALWEAAFERWKKDRDVEGEWGGPEFRRFTWESHVRVQREMIRFLREELGCKAMLTDLNGWTEECATQACRADYDYVDNHFYWDQQNSIGPARKGLPARGGSGGGSAIRRLGGIPGKALTRLLDRPFAVSECNFYAPNCYRAEGGMLTGAFAALQDWGALWPYLYSYTRKDLFEIRGGDYGDLIVKDPIHQAFEYAALALFVRGDVSPAPHALAFAGKETEYWDHACEKIGGENGLGALGWCMRVGTLVGEAQCDPNRIDLPLARSFGESWSASIVGTLKQSGVLPQSNATDPDAGIYASETGDVRIDSRAGVFAVATPRTAGLVAPEGVSAALGPLSVRLERSRVALWVSSLDGKTIGESGRLLLVHLTDLKNTGERFRGRDLKTHEDWGAKPYLVQAGTASVRLAHADPSALRVWRLAPSGRRVAPVDGAARDGTLQFSLTTATKPEATLYYEIARE